MKTGGWSGWWVLLCAGIVLASVSNIAEAKKGKLKKLKGCINMDRNELLKKTRALLVEKNLNGVVVTNSDGQGEEDMAPKFQRIKALTGFTGWSGKAMITANQSWLVIDERFADQAAQELSGSPFVAVKAPKDGELEQLGKLIQAEKLTNIAFPTYFTVKTEYDALIKHCPPETYWFTDDDIIFEAWGCGPIQALYDDFRAPIHPVFPYDHTITRKLEGIRLNMAQNNLDWVVFTQPELIAYVLNLAGGDIPNSPGFYSYLVVYKKDTVVEGGNELTGAALFAPDTTRFKGKISALLGEAKVQVHSYFDIYGTLVFASGGWVDRSGTPPIRVRTDPSSTNLKLMNLFADNTNLEIVWGQNIIPIPLPPNITERYAVAAPAEDE